MTDKNETGQFDEEEIIDLTETAAETPSPDEPAPEVPEVSILDDDADIESFDDDFEDDMDLPPDDDDDFVESMGMEVESAITEEDTVPDFREDAADAGPVSVTSEQVEAALERVVRNLYAEKIESILLEVVKKTITKEIDRLKGVLLEDLKGDD